MKKWRIEDSEELYNIKGWGVNYFGINEKGHATVSPKKNGVEIDLKEVVDQLASRHVAAPVLLRFPDQAFFEKTPVVYLVGENVHPTRPPHLPELPC